MPYPEAYDKIIQAYFRDEIQPMSCKFCFCGTLSPTDDWGYQEDISLLFPYSIPEYKNMETALMLELGAGQKGRSWDRFSHNPDSDDYEDRLFLGMTAALEVLKQIHRERGEDVDSMPALTKRKLQNSFS